MKSLMKNPLFNDVLTGILIAATITLAIPAEAWADLAGTATIAEDQVASPMLKFVSYGAYIMGGFLVVHGIAHVKKHADNPSNNPLGPAVGKLGAGAALLAAPSVVGMLQQTGANVNGNTPGTFNTIGGFN